MPSEIANIIVYIGALVGLGGLAISLFTARKAVHWKRAELASAYFSELGSNSELVFACRALEWTKGFLVVPETLAPLWSGETQRIEHRPEVMRRAMTHGLTRDEFERDERLQIYRTAFDSLLNWLSSLELAFERNLFDPADLEIGAYWVALVGESRFLHPFIQRFHYARSLSAVRARYHAVQAIRERYDLAPVDFSRPFDDEPVPQPERP